GLGREDLHREPERSQLGRLQRAHPDHLPGHFFTSLVLHGEDDAVFPGLAVARMADGALDAQGREARSGPASAIDGLDSEVVTAGRAGAETLEDGGPAVRTAARLADARGAAPIHRLDPLPLLSTGAACPFQPKSALPRMREPAATVSEPALRSPMIEPLSRSSTRDAAWILPWSSPEMMIVSARTSPASWAPCSIVRLPST